MRPTHVLAGPLVRQASTAALAREGNDWPEITIDARLAEYDGDGLVRTLAPLLAQHDPHFAALARDFRDRRHAPDRNKPFQAMLEALADAWQRGVVMHDTVEPWAAYRARVQAALHDLLTLPSGSTVLAFTSGGVIGLAVALALDAPDASALKLNWRVRNGSLTRFTFGAGRVSLDRFNDTAHLTPDLNSWR